ncbi:MAG: helix-turn-helix transcriptional regulator [Clostridia bacterium]|nr:helix-turn-helix transcriptional regulator [Clostridia bacterium]MBQ3228264.1 helix-turn-helix transcriptional regulator [Clostridia bacterium]
MNIGENIYNYRTGKSMSQTDLANALEVSRQSVSKWENNSAVPDLERIIKMSELFEVTLDELVFGKKSEIKKELPVEAVPQLTLNLRPRVVAGSMMLIFGMIFFLLAIFWGDHLWFGEVIGELLSISITLIGLSMLATYNGKVLVVCSVIYMLYSIVCFGFLHITSLSNYIFIFFTSFVILIWFLAWGKNATKGYEFKSDYLDRED